MVKHGNHTQIKAKVELTYNKKQEDFTIRLTASDLKIYSKRFDGMDSYFDYLENFDKQYSLVIEYAPTNLKGNEYAFMTFNMFLETINDVSIYA